MTNLVFPENGSISDEMLVAYLDDALSVDDRNRVDRELAVDEELRQRLQALDFGDSAILRDAFDLVLTDAPHAQLENDFRSTLSTIDQSSLMGSRARPRQTPSWAALAASVIVAVGIGVGSGAYLQPIIQPPAAPPAPGWRATVASYVALYTPQSFAVFDRDPVQQLIALEKVSTQFGVDLSRDQVETPGLSLQQAQLLEFNAKPLAQIAYLHDTGTPVALCLIPSTNADTDVQTETRNGLSVVHWVKGGVGYMVIGDLAFDVLEPLARDLEAKLI